MSRKGKLPIAIPKGVEVKFADNTVTVKGPKGELTQKLLKCVTVEIENDVAYVKLVEGCEEDKNFHGLYRSLVANMVQGVTEGFNKDLTMQGVGYRANVQGTRLNLLLGYSHDTFLEIPSDLQVTVKDNVNVTVSGANKQRVGQFAADIRAVRPPEVYKGKGVRYVGEYVRRKAGKAGKK